VRLPKNDNEEEEEHPGFPIKQPGKIMAKLGAGAAFGLKCVKAINGLCKAGRFFGLPLPTVPDHTLESAEKCVDGLSKDPPAFLASDGDEDGDSTKRISANQLKEFKEFLDGHGGMVLDSNRFESKGIPLLYKVMLERSGEIGEAGECLWVSEASQETLANETSPETGEPLIAVM
jgi:hypothetical protein